MEEVAALSALIKLLCTPQMRLQFFGANSFRCMSGRIAGTRSHSMLPDRRATPVSEGLIRRPRWPTEGPHTRRGHGYNRSSNSDRLLENYTERTLRRRSQRLSSLRMLAWNVFITHQLHSHHQVVRHTRGIVRQIWVIGGSCAVDATPSDGILIASRMHHFYNLPTSRLEVWTN